MNGPKKMKKIQIILVLSGVSFVLIKRDLTKSQPAMTNNNFCYDWFSRRLVAG